MLHGTFFLQEHVADLAVPCFHLFIACANMTQCNSVTLKDTDAMVSD